MRFNQDGFPIRWRTNGSQFLIEVEANTELIFAVGAPDPVVGATRALERDARNTAWFVSDAFPLDVGLIGRQTAIGIDEIDLQSGEFLHVARNRMTMLMSPSNLATDWIRFQALVRLATELVDAAVSRPAEAAVSDAWGRWAITDDEARDEQIRGSTEQELDTLICAVRPLLDEIDAVLNAAEDPLSEPLIQLAAIAQSAIEAKRELERRNRSVE